MHAVSDPSPDNVLNCTEQTQLQLKNMLAKFGLTIVYVELNQSIPGSFFGEREAGLKGNQLYLRYDTPVHSALHEACHYICMSPERRNQLDTDAEGDFAEENGVCYLQILLADELTGVGQNRMMIDMDRWGYSFRLGSARTWFETDAEDAVAWLQNYNIIDQREQVTWQSRQCE